MAGNKRITIKDITLIAVMTTLLFVQEQLLSSLPGIQLTIFLMILYTKKLGFIKGTIIIIVHTLLDNLFMGSFSLLYTPVMFVGWLIIPLTLCTIFKKINSTIILAIIGIVYAFIYSWLYMIPMYFIMHVNPLTYLVSDIIFEITLAGCSFVSILFLYRPCSLLIDMLLNNRK